MTGLTDDDLDKIEHRASVATPGPWFVRLLDDDHAAALIAVSTSPDDGRHSRWPGFSSAELVAATLVQNPQPYVEVADGLWRENAAFIAHARDDVPRLINEIRRLRNDP